MKLCIEGDIYFIPKFHILETGTVKLSIETGLMVGDKPSELYVAERELKREKRASDLRAARKKRVEATVTGYLSTPIVPRLSEALNMGGSHCSSRDVESLAASEQATL
jgi:hypothetical protein